MVTTPANIMASLSTGLFQLLMAGHGAITGYHNATFLKQNAITIGNVYCAMGIVAVRCMSTSNATDPFCNIKDFAVQLLLP